jgi:hypothetical protein
MSRPPIAMRKSHEELTDFSGLRRPGPGETTLSGKMEHIAGNCGKGARFPGFQGLGRRRQLTLRR